MAKDLYGVLGVPRSASADEIKQAYRKLSKEWHPDKHKGDKAAETKFKEINEAYEALGDPEKRKMYDQFGSTGGPGGIGGGPGMGGFDFSGFSNGGDFSEIFENFFGGAGGGNRRGASDAGQDREVEVTLELADVLEDAVREIDIRKLVSCDVCDGKGAEKGTAMKGCGTCGGTGQVTRTAQSFFGAIQQRSVCPECRGSGTVPEKPCPSCNGEGRRSERTTVKISIPAGVDDGQTLRVRGSGDAGRRGAAAGDLYVLIRVRQDPRFERDGADLKSELTVHAVDAILGADKEVDTVHGPVTLRIPEGTQPGSVLRIKGKGLPVLSSSKTGDHYVEINVEIPRKLSREERRILGEWQAMRDR